MKMLPSRLRVILVIAFLLFVAVSAVLWIANSQGPASTAISVIFVALGLVLSFFQVFSPKDMHSSPTSHDRTNRLAADPSYSSAESPVAQRHLSGPAGQRTIAHEAGKVGMIAGRQEDGTAAHREDWGEAPQSGRFYGRKQESLRLMQWIRLDRCRVIALLGLGGSGKTALATHIAQQLCQEFEYIFWRSLQNAPSIEDMLESCLLFLAGQRPVELPQSLDGRLRLLLEYFRRHRCLVILDNFESVLQANDRAGQYQAGYEGYGQLLQRTGTVEHQSCLMLTSREQPKEIIHLQGEISPVRSLYIAGVEPVEGREFLQDSGISGTDDGWRRLIALYSGNLLALKLAAEAIREIFGGDIDRFLAAEETVFGDIQDLLEQHFRRLSPVERQIACWLAIARGPLSLEALQAVMAHHVQHSAMLAAISSLQRRSIIERHEPTSFTLQSVISEYVTNELVRQINDEIVAGKLDLFASYSLMQARAKDAIRNSQIRYIVQPILHLLRRICGEKEMRTKLLELFPLIHSTHVVNSYAAGNALNLLVQAHVNLDGCDFSHLTVREAHLQDIPLTNVNFACTHFVSCTFTDTLSGILAVACSRDGETLVAGTASGEIRAWRASTGTSLLTYRGHSDAVWSVAFSPDDKLLASGSQDRTIRIWDASTGRSLRVLGSANAVRVWSVAFHRDGHTLASGGDDGSIRLRDTHTGCIIQTFRHHTGSVLSIAFSPAGNILASSSEDATIGLTDTDGRLLYSLRGHSGQVRSIAFHPDGHLLASGGDDQTIRVWDIASAECRAVLQGHSGRVRSVVFHPGGRLLASGSDDQTVRLWDVATGDCLTTWKYHTNRVWSLAFGRAGSLLVSGSDDQTIRLWDIEARHPLYTLQGHTTWIWSVAFSPDGTTLASSDHAVRLWDSTSGQRLKTLSDHTSRIRAVTFHPDGKLLATGSEDHSIRLWDSQTGNCIRILEGHTNWVRTLAFHRTGAMLASGGDDKTVRLWDVHKGRCFAILEGHSREIRAVAFHLSQALLASSSVDQTVRVWDSETGQSVCILHGHTGRVRTVAFSPKGESLVSGGEDQSIRVWDIGSQRCIQILQGHTQGIRSLAFSPDGAILASSGDDRTIRLWDMDAKSSLRTLRGHESRIRSLAWHPDGCILASGSDDGTIKLWDTRTAACLATFRGARPYEGMNIAGVTGLTEEQLASLRGLGAVEAPISS